jgi:hypothetical protein
MKTFNAAICGALFLFLLAAGAVVAEPPLPLLTFYKDGNEVESRRMTKPEHTAYMKFQHAMGIDATTTEEEIERAAMEFAAASLSAAADKLQVTRSEDDSITIDADVSLEGLMQAVAEGGTEIGKYAERIGKAAENLKAEIGRNSQNIQYDAIAVGEGEDKLTISLD